MHPWKNKSLISTLARRLGRGAGHPLRAGAAVSMLVAMAGARAANPPNALPPATQHRPAKDTPADAENAELAMLGLSAVCPPGSLPDREVCVRIPDPDEGGDTLIAQPGSHFDKKGRFQAYDQIPRRPDRPADYLTYKYPIPVAGPVGSGYDLDRPDSEQRRGRKLSHVGHGGIDLPAPRGTEVHSLRLEHQEGDAEVVFAGKLFGTTVVTRHVFREKGILREYLLLHGHLEAPAPGIAKGQRLPDDSLLGYVGDSGSEGIVHLHLEVRQVREGIDVAKIDAQRLVLGEVSIVCDPRNVLPLR